MSGKNPLRSIFLRGSVLIGLLLLAACTPRPVSVTQRYFWPPPPDTPKIEFLTFLQSDEDIVGVRRSRAEEIVFGRERARPLFRKPLSVASRGDGRLFVSEAADGQVLVLDLKDHKIRSLLDPGGVNRKFRLAVGMAFAGPERLLVVDSLEGEVVVFDRNEVETAKFGKGELTRPVGIAVDNQRNLVYVVDIGGQDIAVFNLEGTLLRRFGKRGGGPGEFNYPLDAGLDPEGNLYILDAMNARVQVFSPAGSYLRSFGERGTNPGSFQVPKALAVSRFGQVFVTDSLAHDVKIFDYSGRYLMTLGGKSFAASGRISPGGFYLPEGIAVDDQGAIWVVDSLNRVIQKFQYLNDDYLQRHPILPGEAYLPPDVAPIAPEPVLPPAAVPEK